MYLINLLKTQINACPYEWKYINAITKNTRILRIKNNDTTLKNCHFITELNIYKCIIDYDLLSKFNNITILNIIDPIDFKYDIMKCNFDKLIKLTIINYSTSGNFTKYKIIKHIIKSAKKLEYLNIKIPYSDIYINTGFSHSVKMRHFRVNELTKRLKVLITTTNKKNTYINDIGMLSELSIKCDRNNSNIYLRFNDSKLRKLCICDANLHYVKGSLKHLKRLKLKNVTTNDILNDELHELEDLNFINTEYKPINANLKRLKICGSIEKGNYDLSRYYDTLEHLNLNNYNCVNVELFHKLKSIKLCNCDKIIINNECKSLERIDIYDTESIFLNCTLDNLLYLNIKGVKYVNLFGSVFDKLNKLKISDCKNIDIRYSSFKNISVLKIININNYIGKLQTFKKLKKTSLININNKYFRNSINLEEINIYDVSDKMFEKMQKIKKMSLCCCNITDKTIQKFSNLKCLSLMMHLLMRII